MLINVLMSKVNGSDVTKKKEKRDIKNEIEKSLLHLSKRVFYGKS